ncbi:MAG TPA: sigma-70 family RNA polymerase sigma factor [Burkholderiaceae bacterium]
MPPDRAGIDDAPGSPQNPIPGLARNHLMDAEHSQQPTPLRPSEPEEGMPHLRLVVSTADDRAPGRDTRLDDWMIAVARHQDRAAFGSLFEHFAPRLKGWLWRTGSTSLEAEEIAQDAFVIVWRKAAQFDPVRASVGSWLFTIARNLRIDRRRAIHDTWTSLDDAEAQAVADTGAGQDETLDRRRHDERVRSAVAGLTHDERVLIQLSYYEDMSHARIAAQLKIPLGTVKTRLRRAAACLRERLQGCRP